MSDKESDHKKLNDFIERIEAIRAEKKEISDQEREVYEEAKSTGFVPKIMRMIVRRREKSRAEIDETEMLLESYESYLEKVPSFRIC